MMGTVSRVLLPKGFAFVTGDDGQEYFFHAEQLRAGSWDGATVHEGVRVEFTPRNTPKGRRALEVRVC